MDVRLDYADNVLIMIGGKKTVVRRGQTVTLTQPEWDALDSEIQNFFFIPGSGGGGVTSVTAILASGAAQTLDCDGGQAAFVVTETDDCVYSFAGAVEGKECVIFLTRKAGGFTPTFDAPVVWPNNLAPIFSTQVGRVDDLVFRSVDGGESWLGAAFLMNGILPALPVAPSAVAAEGGPGEIVLTWALPSALPEINAVNVYRSQVSGEEVLLATIGALETYTDSSLGDDETWFYKVSAVNDLGESPLSAEVSATTNSASVAEASDTFNRANGALGDLETGQTWSLTGTWQIQNNRAVVTATSGNNDYALVDVIGGSDGTMLLDIAADERFCSAVFRYVDGNNFWFMQVDQVLAQTKLFKLVAGVATELDMVSEGFVAGTPNTYEIVLAGSSIVINRDGVEIFNVTDSDLSTGHIHGMRTYGGANLGGYFDNFHFTIA